MRTVLARSITAFTTQRKAAGTGGGKTGVQSAAWKPLKERGNESEVS